MVDLNSLNAEQRRAVETIHGPVLILAGAGTGKTRVITYRIAWLIERGISPQNILGVTFTNKAAREMQERVAKLAPRSGNGGSKSVGSSQESGSERPTICTFHSFCVRVLRRYIDRLGYKRNFVIYSESDQLGAIKKILSQIATKGEKADPAAVLSLLSRYRNGGARAAAFADENIAAMAEHVRSRYESALHACNAVDFDDLILLTLRLFAEHPAVLEECRARYRYVMVDEYQDTNAAQFQLVHALARQHRNLCVVGDDDQSIYGWRGAEIANLLDLEKHFPEVKVVKLEQNYRSTNTILTAANALIKNNVRRRGKQLWSAKGQGAKIALRVFESDEAEARSLAEEIEFARQIQRIPWSDQAVLFRTNGQSRVLETALRQASVRYHLIGGQSYFDRREIKDFVAYLKLLVNPHDDASLLRVANVPPRGLSEATMERLLAASHERKSSVYTAMVNRAAQTTLPARAQESVAGFVSWIERTRSPLVAAQDLPLANWTERWMAEIGYFEDLRRSEKDPEMGESRIRNLRELIATLDMESSPIAFRSNQPTPSPLPGGELDRPPMDRLQTFLEDLMLDTEREEKEPEGDAVTLITMHSCKGLEFPHVYIVGLEDGLLPHARSKAEGTLDEERRLFYVAITRAMLTLRISYCQGRKKYGQSLPCYPSPFLKELPEHLLELAEEREKKPVTVESGKTMFANLRAALS